MRDGWKKNLGCVLSHIGRFKDRERKGISSEKGSGGCQPNESRNVGWVVEKLLPISRYRWLGVEKKGRLHPGRKGGERFHASVGETNSLGVGGVNISVS